MKLDFATTSLLANMMLNEAPPLHTLSAEEMRLVFSEIYRSMPPGPESVSSKDITIGVEGGEIRGRVLTPKGAAQSVMVYYHGGGWVIGNIDDYDLVGRHLAEKCNAIVVMVDYRKSPEHKFPVPMQDCYAALNWVEANRKKIGADKLPLIVAGDSTGGNLATVMAQKTAAENGPKIDLQVLVYPVIDGRMETASFTAEDNQLFLNAELMTHFWDQYCDPAERLNADVSPILADDVSQIAPAIILTPEFDILVDEGKAYADKLDAAGKLVAYKSFAQQMHGFFAMPDALPVGFEAMDWVAREIDGHLNPAETVDAVVVGAGFSGMYQLHRLREMGLSVQVFEAGEDVGGTWFWNRYPGARVDIESMAYSFSFSKELEQDWVWSEKYSPQPELLRYAQHVADRFDLKRNITFNTRVESAHFDDDKDEWLITTECGKRVRARYFVMATGVLSAAKTPDIAGRDSYKGETYQTGLWPKEGVDFTGKRVAIIGTGSSAVQSIPLIAEEADELVVYQRTAAFSTPAFNRPLSNSEIDTMKGNYEQYRQEQRLSPAGIINPERQMERVMDVPKEERQRRFEAAWDEGLLTGLMSTFSDIQLDEAANHEVSEFIRERIRNTVQDKQTADDLTPKAFPYATKRPCIDTDYYETYNRDNVSLVNLRRTPIEKITEDGIETSEGARAFDAIIYATGFDAMTGPLLRVDIRGRGGKRLVDAWIDGPTSYLGIAIHGFPNMFTITGPSSPSVLSNMLVSIEQHVDWVADCIAWMNENGKTAIEPSDEAEKEWAEHTAQLAGMTLFPKADSWYMGANVPGKPRMFLAYVGGVGAYRLICDQIAATGYHGFDVH
ncbi:MAG: alpha/beta hydrolase fold domain-containing protein [PS1 clade bacterium]|nr:alpha/beta hydrolase fold domain-containing protein [PS1 clade bacterium]MBL6783633.1 alpha/beta hydrolase fold domain-containing protein [PS1 clade bacterium]